MTDIDPLLREVAQTIIDSLRLENIQAAEINPDSALFGDGLGLDSIDALEIALAVSMRYGFEMRSDDSDNPKIFSSLRALTDHIRKNRTI